MKLAQTILYEQDVEQAAAFYQRVFELERGEVKRGHCVNRHRIKKGRRQASIGFALSRNDLGAPTRGPCRTPFLDSAPMSADRHLPNPPRPRPEVDVAGAAILAILDARIVLFTSGDDGCTWQPAHRWQRSRRRGS